MLLSALVELVVPSQSVSSGDGGVGGDKGLDGGKSLDGGTASVFLYIDM